MRKPDYIRAYMLFSMEKIDAAENMARPGKSSAMKKEDGNKGFLRFVSNNYNYEQLFLTMIS